MLTDNGLELTDRFVHGRERTPTGKHLFDRVCANSIERRPIRPWRPRTNGMAERFNGRVEAQRGRTSRAVPSSAAVWKHTGRTV